MTPRGDEVGASLRTLALGLVAAVMASCSEPEPPVEMRVVGGDAAAGRQHIARYECGACHRIPGIEGARGTVGPPLDAYGRRGYVAGVAPNRPDVLVRFLQTPEDVAPRTAMPDVGVSRAEARDIAAYLYTTR